MSTPIPVNHAAFFLEEVLSATGGRAATLDGAVAPARGLTAHGVVTDSRRVTPGCLFVALRGDRFDAHRFLPEVARLGAALALVEEPEPGLPPSLIQVVVRCSLTALGDLARLHRARWGGLVVAVAGSAGKTTTKACIAAALEAVVPGHVHSARGNLNNRIGVPMVLLGALPEHRVAVLELGTNQRGEVAELARVSAPDIGVLTLVDFEHTEGIGDLDAIEAEEGALFMALGASGVAVGNIDDARVERQLSLAAARGVLTSGYGAREGASYRLATRTPRGFSGATLRVLRAAPSAAGAPTEVTLESPLVGYPGALATVAALAVCDAVGERLRLGVADPHSLSEALASTEVSESGRLCPFELSDGSLLLDDSYNSNPGSVLSSLAVAREFADARGARLVAVLGEMLELGALSQREHSRVGGALGDYGLSSLIAVQGDAELLCAAARAQQIPAVFCVGAQAALTSLLSARSAGDVVLVKGSRGVRLELVVSGVLAELGVALRASAPGSSHSAGPTGPAVDRCTAR